MVDCRRRGPRQAFTLSARRRAGLCQSAKDFEAPDDADQDGDYEVTVRVTDGANPVEANLTVRLEDVDEVAPTLLSATVIGDTLTLKFTEFLDANSVPGSGAFTVAVDGTARSVDAVAALLDARDADARLGRHVGRDGDGGLHGADGIQRGSTPGSGRQSGGRFQQRGGDQRHTLGELPADGPADDFRYSRGSARR